MQNRPRLPRAWWPLFPYGLIDWNRIRTGKGAMPEHQKAEKNSSPRSIMDRESLLHTYGTYMHTLYIRNSALGVRMKIICGLISPPSRSGTRHTQFRLLAILNWNACLPCPSQDER
ncbi:hypothetical protein V2G26_020488 [Clonostachys chloroleuca]